MFNLSASDGLEWVAGPQGIRVVPVRRDPVAAFRQVAPQCWQERPE